MAPWISSHKKSGETHLEFRSNNDAHLNLDNVYADTSKGHKNSSAILCALKLRRTQLYLRNFMNRQMRRGKLFLVLFSLVLFLFAYNFIGPEPGTHISDAKIPVEKVVVPDQKAVVPDQKAAAPDQKAEALIKESAQESDIKPKEEHHEKANNKPPKVVKQAPRPQQQWDKTKDNFEALGELFKLPQDDSINWWKDVFPESTNTHRVKVLVIINSRPENMERRSGLRKTWVGRCRKWALVSCIFFVDGLFDKDITRGELIEENEQNKDIHLTPTTVDEKTPKRFLYQLLWAQRVYNFEYVMTIDDDMMLCFDRLIQDFKSAPRSNIIWSRIHCEAPIIRPEDSLMMISKDIVEKFLRQPAGAMQCHPKPDQQVALWVKQLKLTNTVDRVSRDTGVYYSDNVRIHRHPSTKDTPAIKDGYNLCHKYLAIRWRDSWEAEILWKNRGSDRGYPASELRNTCPTEDSFQEEALADIYNVKPQLCSQIGGSREL